MDTLKQILLKIVIPFIPIIRINPALIQKIRYFYRYKKFIRLKKPVLFREKVASLLLNSDSSLWTQLSDKYKVRQYVKDVCGKELLNELYGIYQSSNEIDYDKLPNFFVLKTTNGCASNIFVKDKSK
jgi:hypothetical protein